MKKIKILLISLIFLLSGCFNYNELNNIAICTGISIDKDNDQYLVNYMIADTINNKDDEGKNVIYEGRGKTISEAISNIKLQSSKTPYLGHLLVVVISDQIALEGANNALDLLLRDNEIRKKFYLILSKDKASDVLKVLSPLNYFPSENIATNIEAVTNDISILSETTYSNFISDVLKPGVEPILSSVLVKDSKLVLGTAGIFKDDLLVGFSNYDENTGISILTNRVNNMNIQTSCDDNYIVSSIDNLKTNTKIDDNLDVYASISINADVLEVGCDFNLNDRENIKKLEHDIKDKLLDYINDSLYLTQKKLKSDVFGFGNLIYKNNPQKWEKLKNDWNYKYFPNLKVNVDIDVDIKNIGDSFKTLKGDNNGK